MVGRGNSLCAQRFFSMICHTCCCVLQSLLDAQRTKDEARQAYLDKIRGLEDWVKDTRISQAGELTITYDIAYIRQLIKQNEVRVAQGRRSSALFRDQRTDRYQIYRHCWKGVFLVLEHLQIPKKKHLFSSVVHQGWTSKRSWAIVWKVAAGYTSLEDVPFWDLNAISRGVYCRKIA